MTFNFSKYFTDKHFRKGLKNVVLKVKKSTTSYLDWSKIAEKSRVSIQGVESRFIPADFLFEK